MSKYFQKVPVTKEEIAKNPVYRYPVKKGGVQTIAKPSEEDQSEKRSDYQEKPSKHKTRKSEEDSSGSEDIVTDQDSDIENNSESDGTDSDSELYRSLKKKRGRPPGIPVDEFSDSDDIYSGKSKYRKLIGSDNIDDWYIPDPSIKWVHYNG